MDEIIAQHLKEVSDGVSKNADELYEIKNMQRDAANVQKGEITQLKRELGECAVAIGKHAEEIASFRHHEERQNGALEKIFGKLEDIGTMIYSLSSARTKEVNLIERQLNEKIDIGLAEVNKEVERTRGRTWYFIAMALGSVALLFLTVIVTIWTHTFGGLP